jgi:hypothetical protein
VSYPLRFSRDRGILNSEEFQLLADVRDQAGKLTWRLCASMSPVRPP